MDDPRTTIHTALIPVMDAAIGLQKDYGDDYEQALRDLRQVETAVELATDLLMYALQGKPLPSA